jgi:hypothetical protein
LRYLFARRDETTRVVGRGRAAVAADGGDCFSNNKETFWKHVRVRRHPFSSRNVEWCGSRDRLMIDVESNDALALVVAPKWTVRTTLVSRGATHSQRGAP